MFKKLKFKPFSNIYNVFLVFLIVLNVLPLLAPLFAHWGWTGPSAVIYNIYSFFCHQFAWRSLHVYNYQCAWCTRDMFIWGMMLFIAVLVKIRKVKGVKWYWMIPYTIPIALDGGIQTVATILGFGNNMPLYISNNFMRMLSGGIFGIGLGMWLLPMLKDLTNEQQEAYDAKSGS
jgi:uncharacterized membrane protein